VQKQEDFLIKIIDVCKKMRYFAAANIAKNNLVLIKTLKNYV
jgi:hypothetical protein